MGVVSGGCWWGLMVGDVVGVDGGGCWSLPPGQVVTSVPNFLG